MKVLEGTLPGESKKEGFRRNGSGNQRDPTRNRPLAHRPQNRKHRPRGLQAEACGSDGVHQEKLGGWLTRKKRAVSTSPNRGKNEVDSVVDRSGELHSEDGGR